ncbi:uncharacterized protein LOC144913542 [Branchiostoma floridae x Branchiostoma belcheri]
MEVGDPSTELPSPPPGESTRGTRLSDQPGGNSLGEDWSPPYGPPAELQEYLDREFSLVPTSFVSLQSVRTNNDVEGWHTRLNLKAKKAALPLYLLIDLLHREGRLADASGVRGPPPPVQADDLQESTGTAVRGVA